MKFLLLFVFFLLADALAQQTVDKIKVKDLELPSEAASSAAIVNGSKKVKSSATVSQTELEYLDGVTSSVQSQINSKANDSDVVKLTGNQSVAGTKTFTSKTVASSTANGFIPCPVMTEAQRNAIASPVAGDCVYNSNSLQLNVYSGSIWRSAGGGLSDWVTATTYSIGDVVVESNKIYKANTAHTSSVFATQIANWTQLANNVSDSTGVLPLINGGSNKAMTASAGTVIYSDADSYEQTAVGTSGQFLKSNGTSAPAFSNGTIFGKSQNGVQVTMEQLETPGNLLTQTASGVFLSESGNDNVLVNPGFEHSTYTTGWTTSGSATLSAETSAIISGKKAFKAVMSANSVALTQDSTLYASQLGGTQGYAKVSCSNTAAGASFCSRANGTTSSTNCITLSTDGTWKEYELPFVFDSTSNGLSVATGTTAGTLICDKAYLGQISSRDSEVAQAQYGSSYRAPTASCTWTRTNTAFGAPAAVAACPGPTINGTPSFGSWQATDTDLPDQTINNAPPGRYVVRAKTSLNNGTSGQFACAAISDGTTTGQGACESTVSTEIVEVEPFLDVTYTNTANRTFTVHLKANSGAATMQQTANGAGLQFEIIYYPPASKVYSAICTDNPVRCENVFSAKISSGGVVSNESLDWISGNCTAANPTVCTFNSNIFTVAPNCVFSVENVSTAIVTHSTAETSSAFSARMTNSSTGALAANNFSVVCTKQGADFKAQNVITGTFANVMTTPGISKPKTCYYAFGGASATLASPVACSAGTCVEVIDTCNSGSAPTFSSSGIYLNATFASGTFASSSFVHCSCVAYDTAASAAADCHVYFDTGDQSWSTNSSGGGVFNILTTSQTGTAKNTYVSMSCEGSAP